MSKKRFLSRIWQDKYPKKSVSKIFFEICHLAILKKELPVHYASKFLYRKDKSNYLDYLSMRDLQRIHASKVFHRPDFTAILNNKLFFAFFCKESKLNSPKTVSYNVGRNFFFEGRSYAVQNKNDLMVFFEKIIVGAEKKTLFLKRVNGIGGSGCYLLEHESIADTINQIGDEIMSNAFIHQELISQHPEVNKIYSGSVNTIRFDIYVDDDGICHILSALMRFGRGNSIVDNLSSGGFTVPIDIEKKELRSEAIAKLSTMVQKLTYHPDTNFAFKGFIIPFFDEACELVMKCSNHIPNRIIGWDIAITDKGPLVIEGNENPDLHMTDRAYGGYLKHPKFKEIMNHIT